MHTKIIGNIYVNIIDKWTRFCCGSTFLPSFEQKERGNRLMKQAAHELVNAQSELLIACQTMRKFLSRPAISFKMSASDSMLVKFCLLLRVKK